MKSSKKHTQDDPKDQNRERIDSLKERIETLEILIQGTKEDN